MATVSPTPMGSYHFGAQRRPASRNAYNPQVSRPLFQRGESAAPAPAPAYARTYSLNDSSDDEIPFHMLKFSAATNALLNGSTPAVQDVPVARRKTPSPIAKVGVVDFANDKPSPLAGKEQSPFPRRVVRLSSTPSSLKRSSLSSAVKSHNEQQDVAPKEASPSDPNTPARLPRTVRIPITNSGGNMLSAGSSARSSQRSDSVPKEDEHQFSSQDYPSTIGRSTLATSQGSVSKYGTVGKTRYGEDIGLQTSMRVKRVGKGSFLSGPARRGRRRMTEEEPSPVEERPNALEAAGAIQAQESQESQLPESQEQDKASNQEAEKSWGSLYAPAYRDYAANGSLSSKELIDSVLRSKSPPPPVLATSPRSRPHHPSSQALPAFKLPAPRVDLPSTHDQENEVPPTFKRNKQAPILQFDKMEKVPLQPQRVDAEAMLKTASPERRPLAPRSRNTPLRPAPPPPKMSILDAATSNAGAATASTAGQRKNRLKVNGKVFTKLDTIGSGGSSRVYRVMAENSKFFALKRVPLADLDESIISGFKGEIYLLQKLAHLERVIHLYDYELNDEKNTLSVLMEIGELDLNKLLELRTKSEDAKFDPSFVRYHWKEMLECLEAIHACDVVHSDLKPANFVLVKGRLKLIDFGIANAIETDETVNVHRDAQVGTPSYMSPESLTDSNAKPDSRGRIPNEPRLMKLGKPSDIWSLGCILYQMVYGRTPFAHIRTPLHRCQAIINWKYEIEFPTLGLGNVPVPASLIRTLKKCLNRDQHQRPTVTQLLQDRDPFLNPIEMDGDAIPMTEDLLSRLLLNAAAKFKERIPTDAEIVNQWSKSYFERMQQKLAEGQSL